ncbi:uncharacterized protein LOC120273588 [Dioscorea cayenensis subsp. rotundata]|uniref:Uncharacterized protein LOC120273588 n=1 Tax=Dioscorea cayennensis subsp. rotundata TaxID=55577 RepID=A0AB40C8K0_DIOCR|nr:uncharacterized protein LOC120273588 [Dioscorea cayenensis subsp. rotundata]
MAKKLIGLKKRLKIWAKLTFGSIRDSKRDLRQALDDLDCFRESKPLNEEEVTRSESLSKELMLTLNQEEIHWKQRGDKNIGHAFTSFFRSQFGSKRDNRLIFDWSTLLSRKSIINLEDLEAPFSVEEIKMATMDLAANKAPRPDDFPKVVDQLIDNSQSAFIKGRSILDNVVVAEEIIFGLQKRELPGNIVKVDFAKAFDMVDWDFLLDLLEARGFGHRYQHGLHRGDPLSPLLFILVVDVLSAMFNHALATHVLHGVPLGSQGNVCHLQYADDLLILSAGGIKDLRIIKLILYVFEGMSGLAVNLNKTCLVSTKFGSLPCPTSLATLSCSANVLPITYLGIPIVGRRPRRQDWEVLILKIKVRLSSWKANYLPLGGRLILINSVFSELPTYWMSIFRLPKWVCKCIDRLRRDFLWSGPDIDHPKCRLVNWRRLCLPRSQGGWGIINLEDFNCALLGKWWWKVVNDEFWCGSAPIIHNYFQHHSKWNLWLPRSRHCSFFWNGLFHSLDAFKACLNSLVENGESTLLWLDNWYNGGAPKFFWRDEFLHSTSPFATVREVIWDLPSDAMRTDPVLCSTLSKIQSATREQPDKKTWKLSANGSFFVKSFYKFLIDRGLRCEVTPIIFKGFVPRKIAAFAWLVWNRKILTLDTLFARGCNKLPSATCLLCCSDIESIDHLFFRCRFSREHLEPSRSRLFFPTYPSTSLDLWGSWFRELDPILRLPCSLIARVVLWHIWLARNNRVFNSVFISRPTVFLNICHMYLSWMSVVLAKELRKLEDSIAAVRRCIQFSGSPSRLELDPNGPVDFSG